MLGKTAFVQMDPLIDEIDTNDALIKKGWLCASNTAVYSGESIEPVACKITRTAGKNDNKNSLELLFLVGVIN